MREKKGRVILVSTHFMDEADVMADRIGIMVRRRAAVVQEQRVRVSGQV